MKKITIEFEVEDDTDSDTFEDCLGHAMDNWNETELDKCNGWELKEKKDYTKEDLLTDVEWLIGQGVDESEAEPFIEGLLNKRWKE